MKVLQHNYVTADCKYNIAFDKSNGLFFIGFMSTFNILKYNPVTVHACEIDNLDLITCHQ